MSCIIQTGDHFNSRLEYGAFPYDGIFPIYELAIVDEWGQGVDKFDFTTAEELLRYAEFEDMDVEEPDGWEVDAYDAEVYDDYGDMVGEVVVEANIYKYRVRAEY